MNLLAHRHRSWTAVLTAFSFMLPIILAGCGSSTTSPSSSATGQSQSVPLFLTGTTSTSGSATANLRPYAQAATSSSSSNQILSLSLTLTGIELTNESGSTVSILSSPVTFDACSLNGIASPVKIASIPDDTYVSATLTYSNAAVSYVNSSGTTLTTTATLANTSTTFTFLSPITVSGTTTQFVVDLMAAQSVSFSGSTVTVTPDFTIDFTNQSGGGWTGPEQTFGVISALGTSTFTLTTGFNTNITIDVNSSTTYTGVSGFSGLAVSDAVQVNLSTQSDGSLLAHSVTVEQTGIGTGTSPVGLSILTGPVTSVSGSPTSSFNLVLQQALGSSLTSGTPYTVVVGNSTTFVAPEESSLFPGLPFTPSFTASNLTPGQNVMVATSSISGTSATATMVTLAPQAVTGTVASVATSGSYTVYTVTLAPGSSLTTLSGASTVTVYTLTDQTQWGDSSTITTGSSVLFNGLLFNDSGTLRLVAGFGALGWL
jgi:hypothetical protein